MPRTRVNEVIPRAILDLLRGSLFLFAIRKEKQARQKANIPGKTVVHPRIGVIPAASVITAITIEVFAIFLPGLSVLMSLWALILR